MADDPLKTALDKIRAIDGTPALAMLSEAERGARKGYAPWFGEEEIDAADNAVTALDLARLSLLAAVDAALKLADKYDAESKRLWDHVSNADSKGVMTGTASIDAAWNGDAAKAIREVIAGALTAKAAGHV